MGAYLNAHAYSEMVEPQNCNRRRTIESRRLAGECPTFTDNSLENPLDIRLPYGNRCLCSYAKS
ncbi:hypothetical protein V1477_008385 [Vespula maculifrons]|uniref:Uncharacterized protein n=1 Tax=Vespula maculifrons TaxID=7453 RepID=A0ABD2CCV9_VESMC